MTPMNTISFPVPARCSATYFGAAAPISAGELRIGLVIIIDMEDRQAIWLPLPLLWQDLKQLKLKKIGYTGPNFIHWKRIQSQSFEDLFPDLIQQLGIRWQSQHC